MESTEQPWHELVTAADSGDKQSKDRLFATLYAELRRLARRELNRGAGPLISLSATTLVHEAYAGIAQRGHLSFPDKNRFMAYVARAMRGFIVDATRERCALKRGAEFHITHFDTAIGDNLPDQPQYERLSEGLDVLSAEDPYLAELVDLKYFCGFSFEEIAAMRSVSVRTVQRDWEKARLLLYVQLDDTT
jgi:RNA polymerase sigma factor (TIGR02999 family)